MQLKIKFILLLIFCFFMPKSSNSFTQVITLNPFNKKYFAFANKNIFFPLGLNLGWTGTSDPFNKAGEDSVENYKKYFKKLSQNGVNLVRIWIAPWNLPLEHKSIPLGEYDQNNIKALKEIFFEAEKYHIYIILCIDSFNLYRISENYPAWEENRYQVKYGGFLKKPWQFFVKEEAKNYHQKKLLFLIKELSSFNNLFCWEIFNEIDLTEYFLFQKQDISNWIKEITNFLHNNDPYKHLVSISFAESNIAKEFFEKIPELDFVQIHKYGTPNAPLKNVFEELVLINSSFLKFNKPILVSEFGLDWKGEKNNADKKGVHLHNVLWTSIFLNYSASVMLWWWDSFIEKYNLYYLFKAPSLFIKNYLTNDFIYAKDLKFTTTNSQLNLWGKNIKDKKLFIWVQNKTHTWFDVENNNNKKSEMVIISLNLKNPFKKKYHLKYYNTYNFKLEKESFVKVKNNNVSFKIPSILSDLLLILD